MLKSLLNSVILVAFALYLAVWSTILIKFAIWLVT